MTGNEKGFSAVNEWAAQQMDEEARISRARFLKLGSLVLKELLERQASASDATGTGDVLQYWVAPESVQPVVPVDMKPPRMLSILLEGFNRFQNRDERLKLIIPVDANFNQDSLEAIDNLPEPDVIYAERSIVLPDDSQGSAVLSRYAVTRERAYPYVTDGVEFIEKLDDGSIEDFFSRRVPEESTRLARLHIDLVNFVAKPLRANIVGEPDVLDL